MRADVKSLNWHGIIRFLCLVSSLIDVLLRIIGDSVSKRTIGVRSGDKLWFADWCVFAHQSANQAECLVVVVEPRLNGISIGLLVVVLACICRS